MENFKYSQKANGCGSGGGSSNKTDIQVPIELHACMGLNACKGHDRYGDNDCAGAGYCATQVHYCHTMNNCRGQGGCGLYGDTEEQCTPGANDCAWQGSCGTPIPAERFITQGKSKGRSVWQLARKLFEDRMDNANRNVQEAPFRYGPPIKWLQDNGRGESCGYSGHKNCAFIINAEDRLKAQEKSSRQFSQESARLLDNTVENCNNCDEVENASLKKK
ncbi:hypothetical protein [Dokdonia sp.]|uniref:hypothetical protein n=1 Tax=Dokdonia sp. TaxID=2024995 RepID=UPI003264B04A